MLGGFSHFLQCLILYTGFATAAGGKVEKRNAHPVRM